MSYRDLTSITSPVAVSGIRAEHPTPEDQSATIYAQDYIIARASYTAPAFSETNATYTSAYFIGDDNFQDMGDGIWKFTRKWATVPSGYSTYESFAFTFPAYTATRTGSQFSVTAMSYSAPTMTLTATTSGISVGDNCYVSVKYTLNSTVYYQSFYRKATAVGATTIGFTGAYFAILPSGTYSSVSGYVQKATPGRGSPKTIIVTSRQDFSYVYTTTPASDLTVPLLFSPANSTTGEEVTALTASTTPTATDYATSVANGELLTVEASAERWKGNIYVKRARLVPAT